MSMWPKIAFGAGILILIGSVAKAANSTKKVVITPKANLHSIGLTNIKIRVDLNLRNPTDTDVKIKHPFIKLTYNDKDLGSSKPENKNLSIPKLGELDTDPIFIEIPIFQLIGALGDVIKLVTGKMEEIMIKIQVTSFIITGIKNLPIDETKSIPLRKKSIQSIQALRTA